MTYKCIKSKEFAWLFIFLRAVACASFIEG